MVTWQDDVSPGAYALGILSFLLHLLSALTSAAACLWLYHVFIGGGRRRHHTAPAYAPAHARCLPLALALALLGGLLLVASVIGLPVVVRRDFTKAFAPHLDGGFTVRSSWAYGLTLLVCLAACAMAAVLGRRAAHIDRCVDWVLGIRVCRPGGWECIDHRAFTHECNVP